MPPPIARPATISSQLSGSETPATSSVVTMAIAMPTMPKILPCRADDGLESPRSARMKRMPATR
jgi:hypothetical protein